MQENNIAALYIHVPFCETKCIYCDFTSLKTSFVNPEYIYKEFAKALKKEITLYKSKYPKNIFKSLYFGGGTPSILPKSVIEDILQHIHKSFLFKNNTEITIEANPQSISIDKLKTYKDFGVNRINLGCQSLNNRILKDIGRKTNKEEIIKKYFLLREIGFSSVNIDLIYGLPSQSTKDYEKDLREAIALVPDHLSLYGLVENPRLINIINKNKLSLPSEKDILKEYLFSHYYTKKNNYKFYEISNWALQDKESKHNKYYWQQKDYLGLGPSAVGTINKTRYTNTKSLKEYISLTKENKLPISTTENISNDILLKEKIMLSLRTKEGLDISALKTMNENYYSIFEEKAQRLKEKGLLYADSSKVRATKKGFLFLNQVIIELI